MEPTSYYGLGQSYRSSMRSRGRGLYPREWPVGPRGTLETAVLIGDPWHPGITLQVNVLIGGLWDPGLFYRNLL